MRIHSVLRAGPLTARKTPILICLLAAFMVAGCATVPPKSDAAAYAEFKRINDPMEPLNRTIFAVNEAGDKYLAKPLAQGYRFIIPGFLRRGISNFMDNLEEPLTFVNDILQAEPDRALVSLTRFVVNSTAGLGGLFEVGEDIGLPRHEEDFGQTFAVWGIPAGPYVVLPFFGPSSVRGTFGEAADYFGDPVSIVLDQVINVKGLSLGLTGLDVIDARYRNLDTLDELRRGSIDFYATARSGYRQNREADIRNGERPDPAEDEEDDFFDDVEEFEDSMDMSDYEPKSRLVLLEF